MKVEKTVKSAVVKPTNVKHEQLTQMWENYQRWLQTKDDNIELYSAHKQQAKRNLDLIGLELTKNTHYSSVKIF